MGTDLTRLAQFLGDQLAADNNFEMSELQTVEIVLYFIRNEAQNVDVAERLLGRFSSINGILSADYSELMAIEGMSERSAKVLKFLDKLLGQILKNNLANNTEHANFDIDQYLKFVLSHKSREEVHAIFLSKSNGLITTEVIARGTVDRAPVYMRELARRAILVGASKLILAHNHPGKTPMPSMADLRETNRLISSLIALEIEFVDHLIVAGDTIISMREQGFARFSRGMDDLSEIAGGH